MQPPPKFASKTTVPITQSREEIERLLGRYGATAFMFGWKEGREALSFEMEGRRYRFEFNTIAEEDLDLTDRNGRRLTKSNLPGGSVAGAIEQANRTRWRELLLGIKAKLVLVEAGITTLEEEFLSQIVLPDNTTMGKWAAPYLRQVYGVGKMPPMLPGAPEESE